MMARFLSFTLWIAAFVSLAVIALMAWMRLTTFGPDDDFTIVLRTLLIGNFVLAAILMEHAIRTRLSARRRTILSAIIMLALIELSFVIWTNR